MKDSDVGVQYVPGGPIISGDGNGMGNGFVSLRKTAVILVLSVYLCAEMLCEDNHWRNILHDNQ